MHAINGFLAISSVKNVTKSSAPYFSGTFSNTRPDRFEFLSADRAPTNELISGLSHSDSEKDLRGRLREALKNMKKNQAGSALEQSANHNKQSHGKRVHFLEDKPNV